MSRPVCVVRVAAQPPLDARCRLDGKPSVGTYLCERGGVCTSDLTTASFSLSQPLPPSTTRCSQSTDCTVAGYPTCDAGFCTARCDVAQVACGSSGTCAASETCVAGFCGVACVGGGQSTCAAGQTCLGQPAVTTATPCAVSGDCAQYGAGATCPAGVCVVPPQTGLCSAAPSCGAGNACVDGECVTQPACDAAACAARATQLVPPGGKPLGPERFSVVCAGSMCGCADGYSGQVCELTRTDPRCPAGLTGLDCATPTATLDLGWCACGPGWSGANCSVGDAAPASVWCVGDDASQALAAYSAAKTVCALNAESNPAIAAVPVTGPNGRAIPCTLPNVACTADAQCGASRCADGVCVPLECPATALAPRCDAAHPCAPGTTCDPASWTCTAPPTTCVRATDCTDDHACIAGTCRALQCDPALRQCTAAVAPVPLAGGQCDAVMARPADAPVGRLNPQSTTYYRVPLVGEAQPCASTCDDGSVCRTAADCQQGSGCYAAAPCTDGTACRDGMCRATDAAPDRVVLRPNAVANAAPARGRHAARGGHRDDELLQLGAAAAGRARERRAGRGAPGVRRPGVHGGRLRPAGRARPADRAGAAVPAPLLRAVSGRGVHAQARASVPTVPTVPLDQSFVSSWILVACTPQSEP